MPQQTLNTPRETTHQRIAAALEAIEQNMSDEQKAVNIDYDNIYSGLTADNVQEAIDELNSEKANTADLGTASSKDFTTSVTQGSDELVTSGAVWSVIDNLPEPVIFKGTLGVNGTITSLPSASSSNEGFEYKVITAGTYAGQVAKVGDLFISNGTEWVYIPSGDETDTDTWRGVNVNGTQLLGNGTSSGNVNFKSGTNVQVSGNGNDITVDVDTTFTDARSRVNIASGDSIKTILSKIKKWFTDLKTVAFTGKTSDLTNDSGFINTVDSSMSTTSTNPLQNKVITKELEGAKTTSGNPITVNDAAPVNAVDVSVDVEPIQDLHGYDHPWVGGAGKNKLPMTVDSIKANNVTGTWSGNNYTLSGITFTIQTDSNNNVIGIKINGTKNDNDSAILNLSNYTASSGDILNGCNDTTSNTYYIYARGGGSVCRNSDVTISNNDVGVARLYAIAVVNNTAISNAIVYPMIRLSTETDATFAPYTNICPISGRSEVEIDRVGKNLISEIESGMIDTATGQDAPSGTVDRTKGYSPTNPSTAYTFSGLATDGSIRVFEYGKDKSFLGSSVYSSTNKTVTLTVSENTYFIRVQANNTIINTTAQIQCEKGSTATEYEPYAGKTYTIQFGQTVYGGQLDATKGELVVDRGIKDMGDMGWTYMSSYGGNGYLSVIDDGKYTNSRNGIANQLCSAFNVVGGDFTAITTGQISIGSYCSGSGFCGVMARVPSGAYLDANDFKTKMTGQKICYELATPITIPLTPQQIKLLENTNTLYTDYEGDTITIEYQPNNAIGEAVRVVEESYDAIIQNLIDRITALENS